MSNALEGIKGRLAAATPGPWGCVADTYRSVPMLRIGSHGTGSDVAQVIMHAHPDSSDAVFIANAPTDMARLLAAVESVDAAIQHEIDNTGDTYGDTWNSARIAALTPIRAALTSALGDE